MVADAATKAQQYRERRAALESSRSVRFRYVPAGSEPPVGAYAVKRISFIRHGQGDHNLHAERWKAANKPGNPYGPGACAIAASHTPETTMPNSASIACSVWPTDSVTSPRAECALWCCRCRYNVVPHTADKLAALPHLVDPALTVKGVEQARALQDTASAMRPGPELIVVSPMRRAVDTALLAFAHVFDDSTASHTVPLGRVDLRSAVSIVGHELCRESYARSEKTPEQTPQPQGNICDKRRPLEQIAADYPYIDWALVNDGPTDVLYERGGEDVDSFVERAYRFMLWVGAREEENIVVACHSGFLLNVFNSVIEFPSQGTADTEADQMQSWFETGEMRTLSIAVLGNPHPWAPQPVTPHSDLTLLHSPATAGGDGPMGVMGPAFWVVVGALATFAFKRICKMRP